MNIQYMTPEKNGVPTGDFDWRGRPRYRYRPDWDEMICNASCDEEIECLEELKKADILFAFEIVFTMYAKVCGERMRKWTVLQNPWYEDEIGKKCSKSDIDDDIKGILFADHHV